VLTAMLALFAVNVPLIVAFTVAAVPGRANRRHLIVPTAAASVARE